MPCRPSWIFSGASLILARLPTAPCAKTCSTPSVKSTPPPPQIHRRALVPNPRTPSDNGLETVAFSPGSYAWLRVQCWGQFGEVC